MRTTYLFFAFLFIEGACLAQDTWNQKAIFIGGNRRSAAAFSIGDKGYVGAGFDLTANLYSDLWEYDQSLNTWSQKASFGGVAREAAFGFAVATKGYIGGGYDISGINLKDFYEYSQGTNSWTKKADFGGGAIISAASFSIGNKGYVGTGVDSANVQRRDFWEYDPSLDSWTRKADFGGTARFAAVGFSIGTKGYLGTGRDFNSNTILNDFWEWNQGTNTWSRKTDFPLSGEFQSIAFTVNSKGYILTGSTSPSLLEEYNPCTDRWLAKTSLGFTRTGSTGFSIGNYGYLATGIGDASPYSFSTFWEYTPTTTVNQINTFAIPGSPFCAGTGISVGFYANGDGNNCNVFTAQLSDATGSFANAVTIGTLVSTQNGTNYISSTIPFNTGAGSGYRIRVVSSDPAITGSDNGSNITIAPATVLNLTFFTQGYFVGGGAMQQVLSNELVDPNPSSIKVDTFLVELHNPTSPYAVAGSYKGIVDIFGNMTAYFTCAAAGHSYYISIRHRNTVETWSAAPVALSAVTNYDFTTAITNAYANNMTEVQPGLWAFYTGDINQDTNVDLLDFPPLDAGIVHGFTGYYATDLNGDGNVDLLDFPLLDSNINSGIFSQHP